MVCVDAVSGESSTTDNCRASATTVSIAADRQSLLRYYNGRPQVLDHFYTANFSEIGCGSNGWWYEATIGEVLDHQQPGTTALYRFWNATAGDHFYTTDPNELKSGSGGYVAEGVLGYVFTSPTSGTVALHRWYNGDPNVIDHLYTTDPNERPGGYTYEGIVGFVYPGGRQFTCPRSDLTITEIEPVQAVYGVDLVLGKSTAYRVEVDASDCIAIGAAASGPIEVAVIQDGVTYTGQIAYSDFNIRGNGQCAAFVHVLAGTGPSRTGSTDIRAVADTNFAVNEGNWGNNELTRSVTVQRTPSLAIVYIPFGGCDGPTGSPSCYSPVFGASADAQRNDAFIRATFPLAEQGYSSTLAPSYLGSPIPFVGLYEDVLNIAAWGKRTNPLASKFVGIVPVNYFTYHGFGNNPGLTFLFGSSLVTENTYTTAAHELGHQFGLHRIVEEYRLADPGHPAPGYWVNGRKEFFANSSFCFMGRESNSDPLTSGESWIDVTDYMALMRAMVAGKDPASLMVTGFLNGDGTVELRPAFYLPNAVLSVPDPEGKYVIRARNFAGAPLSETAVSLPLIQILEPEGTQVAPRAPFVFTIAYPKESASVEIAEQSGKVLVTFVPSTKLLVDALRGIPDGAFQMNPIERRKALLNKVEALGQMIATGNTVGAAHALQQDVRQRIEDWIRPVYAATPLQLSRDELLRLVDELSERLLGGGR